MLYDWSRHSTVGGVCRLPLESVFACWFVFQSRLRRKKEKKFKRWRRRSSSSRRKRRRRSIFFAGFCVYVPPKLLLPQEDRLSDRQTDRQENRTAAKGRRKSLSRRMSPNCVTALSRTRGSTDGQTKLWHLAALEQEEPETEAFWGKILDLKVRDVCGAGCRCSLQGSAALQFDCR